MLARKGLYRAVNVSFAKRELYVISLVVRDIDRQELLKEAKELFHEKALLCNLYYYVHNFVLL